MSLHLLFLSSMALILFHQGFAVTSRYFFLQYRCHRVTEQLRLEGTVEAELRARSALSDAVCDCSGFSLDRLT